ncbi:hypothetical protein [Clostridium oryzae]|uniref:Uncharacterized protein n=1 Tax=Clostridium oryzae TaxID=1450648 RepID=A0A1V4IVI1_9CLOT|nr:hypothetical protein [Clostridium oryzae]OPJ63794.1 hypothetical protein CLORY_09780 [Clostridium oryzae]
MFAAANFYIIVSNNSFIIKKEGEPLEKTIELQSFIPNVPAYHHLFDKDKANYIEDIRKQIKSLKIKNAVIVLPDDAVDVEVDQRVLIEFFMLCGVKKTQLNFQCFLLSLQDKKYVSISKTVRNMVVQYIEYNKVISRKYYEKDYSDMEQLVLDIKSLNGDYEYGMIPLYINNMNGDMESFNIMGNMVSLDDIIENAVKNDMR